MGYRPRLPNSDVFTLTFNQADAEEVPKWVGAINTFLERKPPALLKEQ